MKTDVRNLFQKALQLHQAGQLRDAERLYNKILQKQSIHGEAIHLLGLIRFQQDDYLKAVTLITRAIEIDPGFAAAHYNLGRCYEQLSENEKAIQSYNRSLSLKPDDADCYLGLGNVLNELKRLDEALASYDRAIAQNSKFVEAHNNRGKVLKELKRLDEALASCDRAIALNPKCVEAHNNRGNVLKELKRFDEALASYNKATTLKPDNAEAYYNRGKLLKELNQLDEALASYDKAVAQKPDNAEAHYNRGNLLKELNQLDEALASYDKAVAQKPDYAEAYYNRGITLSELKRLDEALASYDKAIALKPNDSAALWNQANTFLLMGRFEHGFSQYENRESLSGIRDYRDYHKPIWLNNQNLSGKKLLIYHELYLGDMIQFCRYAKLAEAEGATVCLSAQNCLHDLLMLLSPTIEIIAERSQPSAFDYHIPLMSLPLAFKTTEKTIPAQIPYLQADGERIEKWKRRIGAHGFKIGICWQGSKLSTDNRRSFPLSELYNISQFPNVRLISLQKYDGLEQLAQMPEGMTVDALGDDFDAGGQAFLDTAAVMKCMDLVITCDTAIAHLAGALAVPTWIVLKRVPEWRWQLERSDSPWYPTMRLFRQQERGIWRGAFAQLESALTSRLGSGT